MVTKSTTSSSIRNVKRRKPKDNSECIKQLDKLKETEALASSVRSASTTSESNPLSRETGQRTREKELSLETTLELKEKLIKELETTKSGVRVVTGK